MVEDFMAETSKIFAEKTKLADNRGLRGNPVGKGGLMIDPRSQAISRSGGGNQLQK
jgi:hypothetical protein